MKKSIPYLTQTGILSLIFLLSFQAKSIAECNVDFGYYQLPNSLTIQFQDSSKSDFEIVSWLWNFGDTHMSDNNDPAHTYGEPGTYEVCLTIHDNMGCTDAFCHLVVVEEIIPGECKAWFVIYHIENSLTIQFIGSSYNPNDIPSRLWNFGDGHTADGLNPMHTYDEPGTYEVCLITHDNHYCTDTFCREVIVDSISTEDCHAAFEFEQLDNSLTIHFISHSTSEHSISSMFWAFGDGGISGSGNHAPFYRYFQPGTYVVCLMIQDNVGCTDQVCHEVIVEEINQEEECLASFDASLDSTGLAVHFSNTSSNTTELTTYYWTCGDGVTSSEENPVHTYPEPGNYTVCLIIQDNTIDCISDYCQVINVHESQSASYNGDNIADQNIRRTKEDGISGNELFVTIYPIPFSATTTMHYELKNDEEVNIELNDLFGNRIRQYHQGFLSKGVYTQVIDGSYLNPGIYLVRMTIGSELVIKKITISR